MLGTDSVVLAGRAWHESVFRLMRIACGQTSDMSWAAAVTAAGQARQRFYEAAKRDIGVAAGRTTEAYEWQMAKWLAERRKEWQLIHGSSYPCSPTPSNPRIRIVTALASPASPAAAEARTGAYSS